ATGAVTVWADLGDPQLSATGAGLSGNLDSSGNLSFDWDFSTGYASTATLYMGSDNAYGEVSLTVTGDAVRPQVVEVSPSGAAADLSLITVTFSEPMRAATMTSAEVQLNGPNGLVSLGLSLSTDGETLSITPAATLPPAAYSLSLGLGLRDDAQGNRLDGDWSGVASSFTVDVGDLLDASPAILACSLSSQTFTPDGDPGAGVEADEVDMSLVGAAIPSWWWLTVTDESENLVWSWRSDGVNPGLSWDGRNLDGRIVPAGSYRMEGRAIDSYGNIGDPCTQSVEVAAHVQAP
ncbi:MAG TPA: Ig-like domain-containing protein, partial [Myxococcota bacterium]|nr:Ig-like domain-containing protein [Myxococcota bacterium]